VLTRHGGRRQPRRSGIVLQGDIRDKSVTLARARFQVTAPLLPILKRPPQGCYLVLQVTLYDMGTGPHLGNEFILAEQFARAVEQGNEEIEGASSYPNGLARFQQEPLPAKQAEGTE